MNETILKGNLERLKELNTQENTLSREIQEINRRIGNLRIKRDALKEFLERELSEVDIPWAMSQFRQIFSPNNGEQAESTKELKSTNGHEPNKTHVVLSVIRAHPNQEPSVLFDLAAKYEIGYNYFHTVLGKLRQRELIDKKGRKYFATAKGKEMKLDV
ncbi:MAG TPA: hypothetical protein VGO47_01470 [Chlamydiales bacterium]|jgi:hypothetical protein|nr:hypothetical protein [Chlamydiales bacterium]